MRQLTGAALRASKVVDPASNALSFRLIGATGVVDPVE
jgi:hypothetical protein